MSFATERENEHSKQSEGGGREKVESSQPGKRGGRKLGSFI